MDMLIELPEARSRLLELAEQRAAGALLVD
jgi:hypothetical protein